VREYESGRYRTNGGKGVSNFSEEEDELQHKPKLLAVGRSYADVVFAINGNGMPSGDDKNVCYDYAVSYIGGNATTAAAFCARHGCAVDLIAQQATDRTGRSCRDALTELGVNIVGGSIEKSAVSIVPTEGDKRAMVRCRARGCHDNEEWIDFPHLDISQYNALHGCGHYPNVMLFYAKGCREAGILTSLDGGSLRDNTYEVLNYIDVAIVSDRMRKQLGFSIAEMLIFLRSKGCKVGGITLGSEGMYWFEGKGDIQHLPALDVPEEVIVDGTGCGDFFHGGYLYSYLTRPCAGWREHFRFARRAAAHKLLTRGNEQCLLASTAHDIVNVTNRFASRSERPLLTAVA